MSELAGAARGQPGHQLDPRFDACIKCGLSSRNCQFYACFNYRGEPGYDISGSESRAENTDHSQPSLAYRGRGGSRRGRGNNNKTSVSTSDFFADCEISKVGVNLPQRSYENIDRGKANRRGRGRARQRNDQWLAHQRQSTQSHPSIGRNGQGPSMMASEPPLFYSPVFLTPHLPPEHLVTSVPPSKSRSISGLQGSSNFKGDGPVSIPSASHFSPDLSNNRQELPHHTYNKQNASLGLDKPSKQGSAPETLSTRQVPISESVQSPIYFRHKPSDSGENAANIDQENKTQPVVEQKQSDIVTTVTKSKKKRKKKKKPGPVESTDGGNGTNPGSLAVEIDLENRPQETRLDPPLIEPDQQLENQFQSQAKKGIVDTKAGCDRKSTKMEEPALSTDKELNSGWAEVKPHASTKLDSNDDGGDPLQQKDTNAANDGYLRQDKAGSNLDLHLQDGKRGSSVSLHKTLSLTAQQEPVWATEPVPMNFGIELLNSVIHNNIELIANQGVVIRANSVILSMNSPVIHRMTSSLELKEIDMKEFSEESVRVFVEAAYTGKLPDISSDIFRDLHKISHAFETVWLKRCCFAMFIEFSHQIDEIVPLYEEQVFLFEEAAYVLSKLKIIQFRDVAIARIQSTESGKKMFISKYLSEISSLSACHLDMIVLLAGSDVDSIVEPLKELLLKQLELKETVISEECKYLLDKCDLTPCRRYSSKLFEQLFDVLQELAENSSEDMKWVFQLHRKSAIKIGEVAKASPEKKVNEESKAKTSRKDKWFWQK